MTETESRIKGLRIVQITALGASARLFLVEHFRKLREAGADVILISSDDADAQAAAQAAGIRHQPVPIRQHAAPLADLVSTYRLWRAMRQLRPDVVHAHMGKAGLLGNLAAWLARVPVRIYHNHAMTMSGSRGLKRWLLSAIEGLTHRFATHSLFCSDSTRDLAVQTGLVSATKARVLGDGTISGVDTVKFAPDGTGGLRT